MHETGSDTTDIKIDPKTNTLKRDGVPSIMNPDDKTALEVALRLKDEYGAEIAVISMGPPQAEIMLREALAMGADEAYLMTDRAFAGSDTLATSTIIAAGIKKWAATLLSADVRQSTATRLRWDLRLPSISDGLR